MRLKEIAGDNPSENERQVLQDLRREMFEQANVGLRANPWLFSLISNVLLILELIAGLFVLEVLLFELSVYALPEGANLPQILFHMLPAFISITAASALAAIAIRSLYYDALYKWEHWQAERSQARGDEEPDEREQNHEPDRPEVHMAPPSRRESPYQNTSAREPTSRSRRRQHYINTRGSKSRVRVRYELGKSRQWHLAFQSRVFTRK